MDTSRDTKYCQSCRKSFTQKSSLVRHLRLCNNANRPTSLRQKSCQRCTKAKAKCDLRRPNCSRCNSRELTCIYPFISTSESDDGLSSPSLPSTKNLDCSTEASVPPEKNHIGLPQEVFCNDFFDTFPIEESMIDDSMGLVSQSFGTSRNNEARSPIPDFTALEDSWCLFRFPSTLPLVEHSMQSLLRVLRTWPRMLAKGLQLPPIFHDSITHEVNIVPLPLANCCTLVKMWSGQFGGTSAIVQSTVSKEMKTLLHNFKAYDEADSLAALQAIIIYTIMIIFPSEDQKAIPFLDTAIFTEIQHILRDTAQSGMVLQEETKHCVPSWHAWVHVSSKRRVVFSLYLLHWAYSVYHRIPSFNCKELSFILAPAPKYLWQARSEEKWENLYTQWLAQWDGREYMQHEFMNITPGPFLDKRTQMWLEDTDELGLLFMSIRKLYPLLTICPNPTNVYKSTPQIEKTWDVYLGPFIPRRIVQQA